MRLPTLLQEALDENNFDERVPVAQGFHAAGLVLVSPDESLKLSFLLDRLQVLKRLQTQVVAGAACQALQ